AAAARSAADAQVAAAEAAADGAAARAAGARANQADAQAHDDAVKARRAANAANSDAAIAGRAAAAAAKDATAARGAATRAESDAIAARDAAGRADTDAKAAEDAATRAEQHAKNAADAARNALTYAIDAQKAADHAQAGADAIERRRKESADAAERARQEAEKSGNGYGYDFNFDIRDPRPINPGIDARTATPAEIMAAIQGDLNRYFPIHSDCGKLEVDRRCDLSIFGPVRVAQVGPDFFIFESTPEHLEGPGKYIRFGVSRNDKGKLDLSVKAWGQPSKIWDEWWLSWANNFAAHETWGLFAENLGLAYK
ncbi:hypothetical protein ACFO3B_14845, partial [Amycolatopsis samaneae]